MIIVLYLYISYSIVTSVDVPRVQTMQRDSMRDDIEVGQVESIILWSLLHPPNASTLGASSHPS